MKLKVGHLDYEVVVLPDLHHEDGTRVWGFCSKTHPPTIAVDAATQGARKAEVFLHEVLHACWHYGCLGPNEERSVDVLASHLIAVAKDNPWFLPELQRLTEGKNPRVLP